MTEKERNVLVKEACALIELIKKQFEVEVIKDHLVSQLVNTKTNKYVGFAIRLELSTRYDYDEYMLTQWKKMLKADEWYISARRCQLHVTFKVRYKEASK